MKLILAVALLFPLASPAANQTRVGGHVCVSLLDPTGEPPKVR